MLPPLTPIQTVPSGRSSTDCTESLPSDGKPVWRTVTTACGRGS